MNYGNYKTIFVNVVLGIIFIAVSLCEAGEEPLRIGATVSLEGKYSETSFMIHNAYKLWEEQVNNRGGILGRPVKLILYDDKSNKERIRSLYEKLITEDRVDFVLSPYGTPLTLVASEVTERHGYVMIACAAAGEQIWERGFRYVFGMHALSKRYFIGYLDLVARNGLESMAILFEKTSFNITTAKGAQQWADRFGLIVDINQGFDGPHEFPGLLQQLKAKNVDGLIFSAYPPECYTFIHLMKKARYRPKAMAFAIAPALPGFHRRVGTYADGVFGPSQWEADKRIPFPGTVNFIDAFIRVSGKVPSYHAGGAYGSCQILEKVIIQTRSFDHEKIMNAIHSLDTVTVTGRFKVDHSGRQIGHNPIIIQWQNGKKEIVYPAQMMTSQPQFNTYKD
jgi:branched-chain amino acid transport system substrate-binding protein